MTFLSWDSPAIIFHMSLFPKVAIHPHTFNKPGRWYHVPASECQSQFKTSKKVQPGIPKAAQENWIQNSQRSHGPHDSKHISPGSALQQPRAAKRLWAVTSPKQHLHGRQTGERLYQHFENLPSLDKQLLRCFSVTFSRFK